MPGPFMTRCVASSAVQFNGAFPPSGREQFCSPLVSCGRMAEKPSYVRRDTMGLLGERLLQLTRLRYEAMPLLMNAIRVDEAIGPGDVVARVLKVHLLSETAIDKLLQVALAPNGDAVLGAGLTYARKLRIAARCLLADDVPLLPDFVVGSLRKLNHLRNRLAHELGATVTRD